MTNNLYKHLLLPCLFLALLLVMIEWLNLDFEIAQYLYQLQGEQWQLKNHWIFKDLLHTAARKAIVLVTLMLLIIWLISFKWRIIGDNRANLGYLLLSAIVAAMAVNLLKSYSNIDCPWHVIALGGELPYLSLYQDRPLSYPEVNCFPAGHASAGYAWFGLYFVLRKTAPKWKTLALFGVLTLGLVFGITQQLRGAHFISHDIYSLLICWMIAAAFSPLLYLQQYYPAMARRAL